MLLRNLSTNNASIISAQPFNTIHNQHQKKQDEPKFCITRFSGQATVEASSCEYRYFMADLRITEGEIVLALVSDLLEVFLDLLSTSGIYNLALKLVGVSVVALDDMQKKFPLLSLHLFEKTSEGRLTIQMVENLSKSIQESIERCRIFNFNNNKKPQL